MAYVARERRHDLLDRVGRLLDERVRLDQVGEDEVVHAHGRRVSWTAAGDRRCQLAAARRISVHDREETRHVSVFTRISLLL